MARHERKSSNVAALLCRGWIVTNASVAWCGKSFSGDLVFGHGEAEVIFVIAGESGRAATVRSASERTNLERFVALPTAVAVAAGLARLFAELSGRTCLPFGRVAVAILGA